MSTATTCAACRITRPMVSLLEVTNQVTGRKKWVCRPSLADQVPGRPPCFGIVGPASVETIALASDRAAMDEQVALAAVASR